MMHRDFNQLALELGSATLHEAFDRKGDLPAGIRAVTSSQRLVGLALTVATKPGNNLMIHRAIARAKPGDVLVVALTEVEDGGYDFGYWGDVLTTAAIAKGIVGLVIDGCVRDVNAIDAVKFPVFARGTAIRGTTKVAVGSVDETVQIGSVAVSPGDLVVADSDGVVVLPAQKVSSVLLHAQERTEKERRIMEQLQQGKTTLELYGFQ